ncbi:MAG: dethiobiotin synthase [Tatlockia sp.]|nr:dethiobiotin synthase [Tatlockia sp.]
MIRYFITGTDTDCGKTYVTCKLLDYFRTKGKQALALKPIASGCNRVNEQLISEDVVNLQNYNGDSSLTINGWRFAPPISPHLAAKEVNTRLSAQEIADFCLNEQYKKYNPLLIEGAGGLMVPLNDEETWLDFLELTKVPVIIVVAMRLGCLNHALLTAAALKTKQITAAGWIANCLDPKMLCLEENIDTLSLKMQMPLLGVLPYGGKFQSLSLV